MQRPLRISSVGNERVKGLVRLLRDHRERRRSGLFVAEGLRQVTRGAGAGLRLVELWVCAEALQEHGAVESMVSGFGLDWGRRVDITAAVLAKIAYRREGAEGVLAVFEQPHWDLDGLAGEGLWLIAVGISKPGNLGAMARSAAAAGAAGFIVAEGAVDAFNPNAIWASSGAVYTLPIVGAGSREVLEWLAARKVRLHAATVEGDRRHDEVEWGGVVAAAIGAEDRGLGVEWLEAARASGGGLVRIDMAGGLVDSLNASVAAGVLLFEARRQRGRGPDT